MPFLRNRNGKLLCALACDSIANVRADISAFESSRVGCAHAALIVQ